ncbi:TetR/AcrR family transcriptional regulator [Cytobacillus firmus]|uniref:TetR/AcrR family transcriptional regulator n=1 Tax=Cytobacillus firmus TaxID=1399 RepID=UPI0036CC1F83
MTRILQPSKGQERKTEILDAALTLFVKKGFHGTSIQDIADASGLTKGGLYHYLKSKDEILFLLHDRFICEGISKLQLIEKESLSPKGKLLKLLMAHLEIIHDYKDDITIFYKEWGNLPEENFKIVKKKRTDYANIFIKVLEEGKVEGIFNVEDSKISMFYILGASNFMYHWYEPQGERPLEDLARIYLNIITNGILKDS